MVLRIKKHFKVHLVSVNLGFIYVDDYDIDRAKEQARDLLSGSRWHVNWLEEIRMPW